MIFSFKPKPKPKFINIPVYVPGSKFVGELYNLIYYPPISLEMFRAQNIDKPCRGLYNSAVNVVKTVAYQLYQIPAVRAYYGNEFLHGVSARYDMQTDELVLSNLDDTEQCEHFTRELAAILTNVYKIFLEKYDCYIYYRGDSYQFITAEQRKKLGKKLFEDGRIVWDDASKMPKTWT